MKGNHFEQTVSELQTVVLRTNSTAAAKIRLKEILKKGVLTVIRTVVHLLNSCGYTNVVLLIPLFKNFFNPFFDLGDIIEYGETKYFVKSINLKLEDKTYAMNSRKGINLHSPTDPSDYNCQLGVFVDNA